MLEILKSIGFEETEAKVYCPLQLGPSGASAIARKAGIGHTLLSCPRKLGWFTWSIVLLDKKRIQFGQRSQTFKTFVKSKLILGKERKIRITIARFLFFIWWRKTQLDFKKVLRVPKNLLETLESKSEILSVLDLQAWYTPEFNLFKWGKEYTRERSKRKISERVLVLDTPEGRDWMKHYQGSSKYTNYRWIKPEQVPTIKDLGGEINIYDNKVMMALFKKPIPIGVMIESTALSNILSHI
jgi:hypothetical protein